MRGVRTKLAVGKKHDRDVREERADDEADEPHVVEEREPAHALVDGRVLPEAVDHEALAVRGEVRVRDHHALRTRRAARRELEEREIVRVNRRRRARAARAPASSSTVDDAAERRRRCGSTGSTYWRVAVVVRSIDAPDAFAMCATVSW